MTLVEQQKIFNKYVKNEVKREFGENYLAKHQVRDLDFEIMQNIKSKSILHAQFLFRGPKCLNFVGKAIMKLLPFKTSSKDAWHNAMNSLRQIRHQKKKTSSA